MVETLEVGPESRPHHMRLQGLPVTLATYRASTTTNRHFADIAPASWDVYYLPLALSGLVDDPPVGTQVLLEDDNRGAVSADPVATLDGTAFHLSVKGIGSAVDPFAPTALDRIAASGLSEDAEVRRRLAHPNIPVPTNEPDRIVTGELWLRGSPYGGQGWEHASTALQISERAELTNLRGFRIAPVVKVAQLPTVLEERLRTVHWYRRYGGRIVQEIRLVPSNVRLYFHAKSTIGNDIRGVFDHFGLTDPSQALRFETAYIRSCLAMLTLFARTIRPLPDAGRFAGLDFHDVWLDKDAVVAPDGTVFFVDLEGIEETSVAREEVREKIEDQIYRSLYEFMYGFEQIEQERSRRFGDARSRKSHFSALVEEALTDDPWLRLAPSPRELVLEVRNPLGDPGLYAHFPLLDR